VTGCPSARDDNHWSRLRLGLYTSQQQEMGFPPKGLAQSGKVVYLNPQLTATRVFLIEEHEKVRQALADRLRTSAGIALVGEAGEAEKALEEVRKSHPEVVLIEIKRGDGMGLEIVREVANLPWSPRVVVLTTYESSWERTAAKRAGACDYLLKQLDSDQLMESIQRLAA